MNQDGLSPAELAALIEASKRFAAIVCQPVLAVDACMYVEFNN